MLAVPDYEILKSPYNLGIRDWGIKIGLSDSHEILSI
jgi:hypothetical protein